MPIEYCPLITLAESLAHMDVLGYGAVAGDYAKKAGLTLQYKVSSKAWEEGDVWTVNVVDASGKVLASRRHP